MITHETRESEYCTVAEAALLLRVSKPTIWRWIESGHLPARRLGPRTVRIERSELRRLEQPMRKARAMNREELDRYTLPHQAPRMSESELIAEIDAINDRIADERAGAPVVDDTVALIHQIRRERDERW